MRVNIYAEEMPPEPRLEIITKTIDGHDFTGLRIFLELPASYLIGSPGRANAGEIIPASKDSPNQALHLQAPFIHRPGDDDSSAITFWGKKDLRVLLREALTLLDDHYDKRHR